MPRRWRSLLAAVVGPSARSGGRVSGAIQLRTTAMSAMTPVAIQTAS